MICNHQIKFMLLIPKNQFGNFWNLKAFNFLILIHSEVPIFKAMDNKKSLWFADMICIKLTTQMQFMNTILPKIRHLFYFNTTNKLMSKFLLFEADVLHQLMEKICLFLEEKMLKIEWTTYGNLIWLILHTNNLIKLEIFLRKEMVIRWIIMKENFMFLEESMI